MKHNFTLAGIFLYFCIATNAAIAAHDEELPEYVHKLFTIITPQFNRTAFLDEYARMDLKGKSEEILARLKELEPLKSKPRSDTQTHHDYSDQQNVLCWKALFDLKTIHSNNNNDEERAFTYLTMLKFFFAYDVVPPKWNNRPHSLIKKIFAAVHRITSTSEDLSAKVAKWVHIYEGEFSIILAAHNVENHDQHLEVAYREFLLAAAAHTTQATHLHIAKLILVHGYQPFGMTPEEAKNLAYQHIEMALANTTATAKPRTTNEAHNTKSAVHQIAQPAYLTQKAKIDAIVASTALSSPQALVLQPGQIPQSPAREEAFEEKEAIAEPGIGISFTDEDFADREELMATLDSDEQDEHHNAERQNPRRTREHDLSEAEQRTMVLNKRRQMARGQSKSPSALAVHRELADPRITYNFVLATLKAKGHVKGHAKHLSLTTAEEIRRAYFDLPRGGARPSPEDLAERFDVKVLQVKSIIKKPVTPEKQRGRLDKIKKVFAEFDKLDADEQNHAATIIAERTGITYSTVRNIIIQNGLSTSREVKSNKKRARDDEQGCEDDSFTRDE